MENSPFTKTVLFVHNSNDMYGAEVILLNLIRGLDATRYRALVALPEDVRHINRLSVHLQDAGIQYSFYPLGIMRRRYLTPRKIIPFLFELLRGTYKLRALIKRENVDLVHSNTLSVLVGALAARIAGKPHVWHIHEFLSTHSSLRRALHHAAFRLSTIIVTVSKSVRDHVIKDQPNAAQITRVIYNGIDLDPFLSVTRGDTLRDELNIPRTAILVGMVGRVSRWKGQGTFLAAACKIAQYHRDVYFIAVGGVFDREHHYMDSFQESVAMSGVANFRVSDFRKDIPSVLSSFDLFILPSIDPDPFPTVIVEAMASGLAVVGANHGGVPEMIEHGKTGLLFVPRDSEDLASKIGSLIDNVELLRKMGLCSRQRAIEQFQVARFTEEMQTLYEEAMSIHNGLDRKRRKESLNS